MTLENYLVFVLASIVLCVVPGPDMAYLLSRTLASGRKASFLPQFVDPYSLNQAAQLLFLGLTVNVIAVLINIVIVYAAARMTRVLRSSQAISNWMNRLMGAVFVALGIRLLNERL